MNNAIAEAPQPAKNNTMTSATLTLPSGTVVEIKGTVEEIHRILELHNSGEQPRVPRRARRSPREISPTAIEGGAVVSIHEIINHVRSCDEAERLEKCVLDGNSQVARALLPLYIVHKYMDDAFALAAAEIAEICKQLGVPMVPENVSKTLRGGAARFVMLEPAGPPKKFRINRRGLQHMAEILSGEKASMK
jgi:hypothetical protein